MIMVIYIKIEQLSYPKKGNKIKTKSRVTNFL